MATTIEKIFLSESDNGKPIVINATATAGDLIHTAHATAIDEIWLHASNTDTVDREITIELGSTAADDNIKQTIPAKDGLYLVLSGVVLSDSNTLKAFASVANKINVVGFVNRITA